MVQTKKASIRVILGTGGTIAGRATAMADNVGYVAGEVAVSDLLAAVPPLAGLALEAEQIAQVDSKDMTFAIWRQLALRVAHHLERAEVQGVVITHGTDTLEETAWFLQSVLQPRKPVVMTCAMRPATAMVPDGPQNLLDAVAVAGSEDLVGVVVVCAGQVHRAEHVAKVHSYRLDAFGSGDAGPMGCVEEGGVRWFHGLPPAQGGAVVNRFQLDRVASAAVLPRVAVITSHADSDGAVVEGLLMLAEQDPTRRVRGIVVAATGNGTVHVALEKALLQAQASGVRVVRATRCARGRVIPGVRSSFPDSAGLSPVKARLALALDLMAEDSL
ncbi:asparaginase [Hydrogenophaga sp. PAMC20947]|uniref:asparaginase n=1 Tax=Hydrogenophaga sp. PAMC20947 TaxID=2565558 RepID=UPI00109E167C|nr:asparaginase [Hydrogenophaga sp. PAMC20947]QCB45320.1 asparaginase [Hydrogenophaga sp. PAMC20947]